MNNSLHLIIKQKKQKLKEQYFEDIKHIEEVFTKNNLKKYIICPMLPQGKYANDYFYDLLIVRKYSQYLKFIETYTIYGNPILIPKSKNILKCVECQNEYFFVDKGEFICGECGKGYFFNNKNNMFLEYDKEEDII